MEGKSRGDDVNAKDVPEPTERVLPPPDKRFPPRNPMLPARPRSLELVESIQTPRRVAEVESGSTSQNVQHLDLAELHEKMRAEARILFDKKMEGDRLGQRNEILNAVRLAGDQGRDEGLVRTIILREFGGTKFKSVSAFEDVLKKFLSGPEEDSMENEVRSIDLKKPDKGMEFVADMDFSEQMIIGGDGVQKVAVDIKIVKQRFKRIDGTFKEVIWPKVTLKESEPNSTAVSETSKTPAESGGGIKGWLKKKFNI